MCVSPEASFTAALVLAGMGYAAIREAPTKKLLLLALIPCIFAAQQFFEGVVWLELKNIISPSIWTNFAKYFYLLIAFGLWPIWIPFSLFFNETDKFKKVFLFCILILGIITAFEILRWVPIWDVTANALKSRIRYEGRDPFQIKAIYALIILIPCFLSSVRYMWVFGLLIAFSYLATEYFYTYSFTSVWCFFAAIMSASIYSIIKCNRETV